MDGCPNLAEKFFKLKISSRLPLAISIDWWTARLQSTAVYSIQYTRDKPREDLFLKDIVSRSRCGVDSRLSSSAAPPGLGDHPQEEGILGSRMNEVPTGDVGNQNEPGHPKPLLRDPRII